MASCAVTEDVGRCHQPSPRSSGNGAQPCSAAPWLFLPRLPHSSGSCWVFQFFPTAPGYPTPSVALPPSTSIQWPRGWIPSPLKARWRLNKKVGKMSVISTNPLSICDSGCSVCLSPRPLPSRRSDQMMFGAVIQTEIQEAPEGILAPC